jgi:dTMP kinase
MFIAISGTDGSGKTTLLSNLARILEGNGVRVHLTKNPSPSYFKNKYVSEYRCGGKTSISPRTMALLSAYDRSEQFEMEIGPSLAEGKWVITDRYLLDAIAIFTLRGLQSTWIEEINKFATQPDINLFLDCPAEVAMQRIRDRGEKISFDESSVEVLQRKRDSYLEWCDRKKVRMIDATLDAQSLAQEAYEIVMAQLRLRQTTFQR